MIKIVIIEDEPYAQDELKRLLANSDFGIEVLACIDSIEDAVEYLSHNEQPDLMFLDIQLSDGLSFEIFNKVTISAPIIFTTAYDEYAIQAFKVNSIDYLLKPVEQEALNKALHKLDTWQQQLKGDSHQLSVQQIQSIVALAQNANEYKTRLVVKVGDQIKFIPVQDIAYFYAEQNEVFIMTIDKHRYIVDFTLDQLTLMLDPVRFHRINRAYVINKNAVSKVHKYFNSRLKVEVVPESNTEILVSRVKVPDFVKWMEK